jgi:hypothetical protein
MATRIYGACVYATILAAIVQGVTPDPDSLASLKGLEILAILFSESQVAMDNFVGELCPSEYARNNGFVVASTHRSSDAWFAPSGSTALNRCQVPEYASLSGIIVVDGCAFASLCRLKC